MNISSIPRPDPKSTLWLILRTYTLLLAVVVHTTIARDVFFPRMGSDRYNSAVAFLDRKGTRLAMGAIIILLGLPALLAGVGGFPI